MTGSVKIINYLDSLYENPRSDLIYNTPFELLISVMLSAQTKDSRVNEVTKVLFSYSYEDVINMDNSKLEQILMPLGNYRKKAIYTKEIYKALKEYNYIVLNDREFLESLPGIGRKTCNVVLSIIYNENVIAVDTHVIRVSNRLGITKSKDPLIVEKDLYKYFKNNDFARLHQQLVLFGRYHCTARNPKCDECPLKDMCNFN